jgi:AraC-like DNA-binding protein
METRCPLDDVLDILRVRGAVMANLRARGPWGISLPRTPKATLHAVTAGVCWVRIAGQPPIEQLPGDVVLLPTGAAHILASAPVGPTRTWRKVAEGQAENPAHECVFDDGGGRSSTHVICAGFEYDHEVTQPLLALMPPVLFLSGQELGEGSPVQATLRVLRHELAARTTGSATVIDRLLDVLLVQVIRAWLGTGDHSGTSWLEALRDPIIGRVLSILHAAPAAPWTIESLAHEVSVSRSTLTRRFSTLVGEAPLSYLTRWRMELAARHLRETDTAVRAIARQVGYASEYAFSRTFSRQRGLPPSRYRAERRRREDEGRRGEREAIGR